MKRTFDEDDIVLTAWLSFFAGMVCCAFPFIFL